MNIIELKLKITSLEMQIKGVSDDIARKKNILFEMRTSLHKARRELEDFVLSLESVQKEKLE